MSAAPAQRAVGRAGPRVPDRVPLADGGQGSALPDRPLPSGPDDAETVLLRVALLQTIRLYQKVVPHVVTQSNFDFSKLLRGAVPRVTGPAGPPSSSERGRAGARAVASGAQQTRPGTLPWKPLPEGWGSRGRQSDLKQALGRSRVFYPGSRAPTAPCGRVQPVWSCFLRGNVCLCGGGLGKTLGAPGCVWAVGRARPNCTWLSGGWGGGGRSLLGKQEIYANGPFVCGGRVLPKQGGAGKRGRRAGTLSQVAAVRSQCPRRRRLGERRRGGRGRHRAVGRGRWAERQVGSAPCPGLGWASGGAGLGSGPQPV